MASTGATARPRHLRISAGRLLFRLLLAVPAAWMSANLVRGESLAMDLLHPSGEMAARLMILALLPGPLTDFFGPRRFLRLWTSVRRDLGLAAFAYALLHLVFYVIDMGMLAPIVEEMALPSIWTGWLALIVLTVPASISFDGAMRRLGRRWKSLQRLAYVALAATITHWLLLDWEWTPAFLHCLPLMAAWTLRAIAR
jgi:sulfoxide reductase heme-binding subunit YedZ